MALPQLGPDNVRLQLAKILASPEFVNAERLSHFLRFVVDKGQSRDGGHLKEYVIGVEVYGRSESFDPRTDSIVRVEAGRLRHKLERYYHHEGLHDPIVISLPKGGYAPVIVERPELGGLGQPVEPEAPPFPFGGRGSGSQYRTRPWPARRCSWLPHLSCTGAGGRRKETPVARRLWSYLWKTSPRTQSRSISATA